MWNPWIEVCGTLSGPAFQRSNWHVGRIQVIPENAVVQIVALGSLKKQAQVKSFVLHLHVQSVGEIRMWIADHDLVLTIDGTVSVCIHEDDVSSLGIRQCPICFRLFVCLKDAIGLISVEISHGHSDFSVWNEITCTENVSGCNWLSPCTEIRDLVFNKRDVAPDAIVPQAHFVAVVDHQFKSGVPRWSHVGGWRAKPDDSWQWHHSQHIIGTLHEVIHHHVQFAVVQICIHTDVGLLYGLPL